MREILNISEMIGETRQINRSCETMPIPCSKYVATRYKLYC